MHQSNHHHMKHPSNRPLLMLSVVVFVVVACCFPILKIQASHQSATTNSQHGDATAQMISCNCNDHRNNSTSNIHPTNNNTAANETNSGLASALVAFHVRPPAEDGGSRAILTEAASSGPLDAPASVVEGPIDEQVSVVEEENNFFNQTPTNRWLEEVDKPPDETKPTQAPITTTTTTTTTSTTSTRAPVVLPKKTRSASKTPKRTLVNQISSQIQRQIQQLPLALNQMNLLPVPHARYHHPQPPIRNQANDFRFQTALHKRMALNRLQARSSARAPTIMRPKFSRPAPAWPGAKQQWWSDQVIQNSASPSTASITAIEALMDRDRDRARDKKAPSELPLESSVQTLATMNLNELPQITTEGALSAGLDGSPLEQPLPTLGESAHSGTLPAQEDPYEVASQPLEGPVEMGPVQEPTLQSLIEAALRQADRSKYIPLHAHPAASASSTITSTVAPASLGTVRAPAINRFPAASTVGANYDEQDQEQMGYGESPAGWADHHAPSYGPYGPQRAPKRKRPKSKGKRNNGYKGGGGGKGGRRPSVKVQKRPRYPAGGPLPPPPHHDGMLASPSKSQFHEIDSPQDLQPSSTLLRWKYPWLYRPPYDYDDDEEEGETEVNIRFFNNFSRMGPLSGVARTAGTATLVISLAFLIISNVSLAATVIAHGISALLKAAAQNVNTASIPKPKLASTLLRFSPADSTSASNSRLEKSPLSSIIRRRTTTKRPTTTTTTTTTSTTTTSRPPSMTFDQRIAALGDTWR